MKNQCSRGWLTFAAGWVALVILVPVNVSAQLEPPPKTDWRFAVEYQLYGMVEYMHPSVRETYVFWGHGNRIVIPFRIGITALLFLLTPIALVIAIIAVKRTLAMLRNNRA